VSVAVRCVCHGVSYTTVSAYLAAHPEQLELELDSAVARYPSGRSESYVGTFEDGSQVLLEIYAVGKMTAATRPQRSAVWGPPAMLDEAP